MSRAAGRVIELLPSPRRLTKRPTRLPAALPALRQIRAPAARPPRIFAFAPTTASLGPTEIPSGDRRQLLISLRLSRRFSFLALRPAGWPDLPILYSTIQSSHSEYFAHSTAAGRNHGH
jgi:hypothetical protein